MTVKNKDKQLAQYRAAIVALVEAFRGKGKAYMTWEHQQLIRQVEDMLNDDEVPKEQLRFDAEGL